MKWWAINHKKNSHVENEVERLNLYLLLIYRKALYEVKASDFSLGSIYFDNPQLGIQ